MTLSFSFLVWNLRGHWSIAFPRWPWWEHKGKRPRLKTGTSSIMMKPELLLPNPTLPAITLRVAMGGVTQLSPASVSPIWERQKQPFTYVSTQVSHESWSHCLYNIVRKPRHRGAKSPTLDHMGAHLGHVPRGSWCRATTPNQHIACSEDPVRHGE